MRALGRRLTAQVANSRAYNRFARQIRDTDVFIVSYPRSGTTWLSFLIANFIKPDTSENVTLKNSIKYVPDVNRLYLKRKGPLASPFCSFEHFNQLPDPRFFKVHAPFDPQLPSVVYILRDPRNVMVSYWHYSALTGDITSESLREFVMSGSLWPCRWDSHVSGWLTEHNHPHLLLIRYEEMHENACLTLKRVLEFAGMTYSDEGIRRAVEASRFDHMQDIEEQFGTAEAKVAPQERFVRRGRAGGWRYEMDNESLHIVEKKFGEVMKLVGYSPVTLP